MKVFFGAAIQGHSARGSREVVYRNIIEAAKNAGAKILTEHTLGTSYEETTRMLEVSIGTLPPKGLERTQFVRNAMIHLIESDIDAAIFEVSTPSLGTGIEFAHAYLRPRMGLKEIPILTLYEKNFWPNALSTMIKGLNPRDFPNLQIQEYQNLEDLWVSINRFLSSTH